MNRKSVPASNTNNHNILPRFSPVFGLHLTYSGPGMVKRFVSALDFHYFCSMNITSATFKCSSEKLSQVPNDNLPEFAFIGRSNVGKSSLINMLTDKPSLAKVSGTPGKTRLINHFLINNEWYLVDLPGYGYAKVSKTVKEKFAKLITDYVLKSEKMYFLFVLVDSRLEPQKIDLEFIDMLGKNGVPFGIVFTKTDKLSDNQVISNIARYKRTLRATWEELPIMFATSSEKKRGRDDILDFIENSLEQIAR